MARTKATLTEARPSLVAEATETPGRYLVQLINPGWGSSGYYSADVLSEAATKGVFPAGLHMYADHPTATDEAERPGRSVRDLWGVLESPATVDPVSGALVAEARVFSPYRPLVEEMRDAIGLSIRAGGYAETGEADGREGPIITELTEALSVDFVTAAGRGGKVLELIESARVEPREDVADALAEALPGGMTANDLRDALCGAVDKAFGGDGKYTWVRDYTDADVIYEAEGDTDRGTFRQSFTVADDGSVELGDDRQAVVAKTTWEPVAESAPADQPAGGDAPSGDTPADPGPAAGTGTTSTTEESHMSGTPGAGDTRTPRQVFEAHIAEQDRTIAQLLARDRARDVIARVMAESFLAPAVVARLTSDLLAPERLPLTEEHKLDEDKLVELATTARERGEVEAAQTLEEAGFGRPRSLGDLVPSPEPQVGGSKLQESLQSTFRDLGMSEHAADIAAKGRI